MKKLILAVLIAIPISVFLLAQKPANSSTVQCGIKPIAPIGCKSSDAVCVCDADGNCQWVFYCD